MTRGVEPPNLTHQASYISGPGITYAQDDTYNTTAGNIQVLHIAIEEAYITLYRNPLNLNLDDTT